MDLSLLSQLWSLNESIQEFRTIQEQDNISPTSPNSTNSEDESNNEDKSMDNKSSQLGQEKDFTKMTNENDFIEDMQKKLEKQIKRMNVAPPPLPDRPKKAQTLHSAQN